MPAPSCPRCEARTFEVSPVASGSGGLRFHLVYCTNCGGAIGALPTG